ncbi:hypothetical protein E2C01_081368 [Portunus trituberculatus]|uniref:Uncharacterized protein n=1 Tax=Portunus trituberculatus TaxID=210409 RepID=A0A5B7IYL6_PORTR|nr:hypothetical protein [Portunus trituberculatus]
MIVSSFGAKLFSTSSFILLSIIGFNNACSLVTWSSVSSLPNSCRKVSWQENCVGSRKLSRENNSVTLFCSGVPDSRTRCSMNIRRRPSRSLQFCGGCKGNSPKTAPHTYPVLQPVRLVNNAAAPVYLLELQAVGDDHFKGGDENVELV